MDTSDKNVVFVAVVVTDYCNSSLQVEFLSQERIIHEFFIRNLKMM